MGMYIVCITCQAKAKALAAATFLVEGRGLLALEYVGGSQADDDNEH
jgi:hypothetical protein